MEAISPATASEVCEAVTWALASTTPLQVRGRGTKAGFGRPVAAGAVLTLSRLDGVVFYEPEELVIQVRAGTALAEIEALLGRHNQHLAFEPPDFGPLYGAAAGGASIGGVIACNLSGSGRLAHGAARDHILGVKGVSGRGEVFKAGGRVVKNVTGYDVAKLMTGSFGTLAVLTEVALKVLPAPEVTRTIVLEGLDDGVALDLLRRAASTPAAPTGLAHMPSIAGTPARTLIRLAGIAPSVNERVDALKDAVALTAGPSGAQVIEGTTADRLWQAIAGGGFLADSAPCLWRVCVAPSQAAQVVRHVRPAGYGYDWAGGLIWLAVDDAGDADDGGDGGAAAVRAAIAAAGGGHGTLVRAPDALRARVPVFEPEEGARAALTRRIKDAFDPKRLLNPGRMYEGV